MKTYAPDYYKDFCCMADKCRHSCCIGWEIDIDDATYDYYRSICGNFGKKLAQHIHTVDGTPCFELGENERCPFLNESNLCDIIINLGSESLCQICDDHPRYRNYYSSRTEIGLGLCCEEAARIILTKKEKTYITCIRDDEETAIDNSDENAFFALRQRALDIVQDRSKTITKRISALCDSFDICIPKKSAPEWADIYYSMERLDEEWSDRLNVLKKADKGCLKGLNKYAETAEQLLVYFLYRHMADGIYDGNITARIALAVVSCCIIFAMADVWCKDSTDTLMDTARMYSSEIEYSEENTEKLLKTLTTAS